MDEQVTQHSSSSFLAIHTPAGCTYYYSFANHNITYIMPVSRIAVGAPGELSHPDTAKAAVSEFISMLIFIFAGSGSGMAFSE